MLSIWFARHGEAINPEDARSDFGRVLTDSGRQQLIAMTSWLISRESPPELFLHSPLVRARQTAEAIASAVGAETASIRVENCLSPGVDTEALLKVLSDTMAERILCVCHQPDTSRCLAEMIGGGNIQYSPGTIARVEFAGPIICGAGSLRWVADPRWFH